MVTLLGLAALGCSSDKSSSSTSASNSSTSPDGSAPSSRETLEEKVLELDVSLSVHERDGGASPDGGEPAATATLTIAAHDGETAVVTDLWLYTLDAQDQKTPLTGFTATASRKSPRLMLPATLGGKPSGLLPADDGSENGVMTNTTRGKLDHGTFVSTVNGTVEVTLPALPTSPILVVAGVEDQRYAGAAVIAPDGTSRSVPDGVGVAESHPMRSYARDVAPLLTKNCTSVCHNSAGPNGAPMYHMDTLDNILNDNFALTEQTTDCKADHPDGGTALADCIAAITQAQFLIEPGAPAVSDILQRARPDENLGTSDQGLAWYGGGTPKARYNAKYGDRRMPSTTISTDSADWHNDSTYFDQNPKDYQTLYDWVAQGAPP